jgi:hypothetical protein
MDAFAAVADSTSAATAASRVGNDGARRPRAGGLSKVTDPP